MLAKGRSNAGCFRTSVCGGRSSLGGMPPAGAQSGGAWPAAQLSQLGAWTLAPRGDKWRFAGITSLPPRAPCFNPSRAFELASCALLSSGGAPSVPRASLFKRSCCDSDPPCCSRLQRKKECWRVILHPRVDRCALGAGFRGLRRIELLLFPKPELCKTESIQNVGRHHPSEFGAICPTPSSTSWDVLYGWLPST